VVIDPHPGISVLFSSLALAFQVTVVAGSDSAGIRIGVDRDSVRAPRRIEVTEQHLRTAFKDPLARELLLRARAARLTQDSALMSYEAKTYQRLSVGMNIREAARARLAFRTENATRVRWHRNTGAQIEVLGARTAVPIATGGQVNASGDMSDMMSIPYYPGKEPLIALGSGDGSMVRAEVDEQSLVHPLATGSEAYYTFESGDSVLMTLPDGKRLMLRELRIAAREPKWNLTVGSFWFEVERGHLVRAVYRLSTDINIWAVAQEEDSTSMDDVPAFVKPLLTPMEANITAMSVEYGLQEQRFWMPKLQALEGYARVSFMRIPIRVEERYRYESVNAIDSLPTIVVPPRIVASSVRDSLKALGYDSLMVRDTLRAMYARRDTLRKEERARQCEATGVYVERSGRADGSVLTQLSMPCDTALLARSSELPASIYDDGEEVFGQSEVAQLMRVLDDMGLQAGWARQQVRTDWGLAHTRFNRVEGLSSAVSLRSVLGAGYEAEAQVRASIADLQLNGELAFSRTNGRKTYRGAVYRRLDASSTFGDPLSFGASLGALLYARDEGFYHRAWGAEVRRFTSQQGGLELRAFAEQQWSAAVENRWSLFGGANDDRFLGNVVATPGWYYGSTAKWTGSRGLDPRGWRGSLDVRAEVATGETDFQRLMLETIVSRGLGPIAFSLTNAAGTSFGELPAQRQFFLGGLQSVRGQTPGTAVGESFWMSRTEIGGNVAGARPVVFADLGWAGARDGWNAIGRPLSGVGVGASFLDGLVRIDLARGIHPRWQTRLDLYLEARF
jgi:hypothetical protein